MTTTIKEKKHRLPRECYRGEISAAFTLCLKERLEGFIESQIINQLTVILSSSVMKFNCIVPVYCFMPDHQHFILTGLSDDADLWEGVVEYKQKTGFWLTQNKPEVVWQKDFYDHIIRTNESLSVQVRYILDNPVRKGLCSSWQEYPYKGAIGCNLEDML